MEMEIVKRECNDAPPPIYLGGGAAFRGDRMVGWLDNRESRGWHWVADKVRRPPVIVSSPVDEQPVSVEIIWARPSVEPEVNGDKVLVKVRFKYRAGYKIWFQGPTWC